MTGYIYCYTNLINQKKYIGQTNNYQRRINEHKSCSFNSKSVNYNNLLHKAIRKYGYENFSIELLEELPNVTQEQIDNREAFWIKEKRSLFSQNGYNLLEGGKSNIHRTFLLEEQIQDIKDMIIDKTPYDIICAKYSISKTFVSDINRGKYFFEENCKYPLCPYRIDKDTYDLLIEELEKPELNFREIAEKFDLAQSTVKKFNYGTLRPGYYSGEYPIRKITPQDYKANIAIDLLVNTELSKTEILQIAKISEETLRKINLGIRHRVENYEYPLRK